MSHLICLPAIHLQIEQLKETFSKIKFSIKFGGNSSAKRDRK